MGFGVWAGRAGEVPKRSPRLDPLRCRRAAVTKPLRLPAFQVSHQDGRNGDSARRAGISFDTPRWPAFVTRLGEQDNQRVQESPSKSELTLETTITAIRTKKAGLRVPDVYCFEN
jgi:hypothetical protein